jgi:hypothetical protein
MYKRPTGSVSGSKVPTYYNLSSTYIWIGMILTTSTVQYSACFRLDANGGGGGGGGEILQTLKKAP